VRPMTSPKQLFVHELQDMYYAEKALTNVLPTLASEASDRELTRTFESHLKETQRQVTNLEKIFEKIGERAQGEQCPGIDGIKQEHDNFMREHQAPALVADAFLTGAASRAEHYEIAAYTSLIAQARALGERDSVKLLEENLKQEKEALRKVESISRRIVKELASRSRKAAGNGRRRTATRRSTSRTASARTSRRTGGRSTASSRTSTVARSTRRTRS
jgi:ferritin-like metal-binding protein YciE